MSCSNDTYLKSCFNYFTSYVKFSEVNVARNKIAALYNHYNVVIFCKAEFSKLNRNLLVFF